MNEKISQLLDELEQACVAVGMTGGLTSHNHGAANLAREELEAEFDRMEQESKRLRSALTQIGALGHALEGSPFGTQRQERFIWHSMVVIADEAITALPQGR